MIDALERALAEVHNSIPRQLLDIAFDMPSHMDVSLDERIRSEVFNKRVRKDASIFAGPIFDLILDSRWGLYTAVPSPYSLGVNGSYSTFKIPADARDHRDISCVVSVMFPYTIANGNVTNYYTNCNNGGLTLQDLACSALRSQTGANMISNPIGKILPGNVITLEPKQMSFIPWRVKVRLELDENFSGMEVSLLRPFCDLCRYAVQAYIYSNMIIDVESNMVYRGATVGVIRDLVQSYADANEKYEEILTTTFHGAAHYDVARTIFLLQKCVPGR